jgi:hypothetical protein
MAFPPTERFAAALRLILLKMTTNTLVFDRIAVEAVEREAELADGASFLVRIRNAGDGITRSAIIRADVTGSAMACLDEPVEDWLATCVARTGNSHENDGNKISSLIAKGSLRYDSRYVVD